VVDDDTPAVKEKEDPDLPPKSSFVLKRLWQTYNHNFLVSLGLQYFNQNLTITMGFLAAYDILANRYGMEPEEV
jgi:hypothetical protein